MAKVKAKVNKKDYIIHIEDNKAFTKNRLVDILNAILHKQKIKEYLTNKK